MCDAKKRLCRTVQQTFILLSKRSERDRELEERRKRETRDKSKKQKRTLFTLFEIENYTFFFELQTELHFRVSKDRMKSSLRRRFWIFCWERVEKERQQTPRRAPACSNFEELRK